MGQQQILFLILSVCIIGIALSAGAIVLQNGHVPDQREAIAGDLRLLAKHAQEYRLRPFEDGGGDGTFMGLSAAGQDIDKLAFPRTTPYAEYSISANGNEKTVELTGRGYAPGYDGRGPVQVVATVFADSVSLRVVN